MVSRLLSVILCEERQNELVDSSDMKKLKIRLKINLNLDRYKIKNSLDREFFLIIN